MKKKIIITATGILIIAIITIIILMIKNNYNTDNSKVIYSKSYYSNGFVPSCTVTEIYDNGVIIKEYKHDIKDKNIVMKKLSKKDLNSIKQAIEKVEKCELNKVNLEEYLSNQGLFAIDDVDIYINLNKKIIIQKQRNADAYTYDNKEVEELKELTSSIIKKYLEEE